MYGLILCDCKRNKVKHATCSFFRVIKTSNYIKRNLEDYLNEINEKLFEIILRENRPF